MSRRFDEFIDSPDIREYNKNYEFTPAEWAVIIGNSQIRTAEEKIEAWEYLIENYSKQEFGTERVVNNFCGRNKKKFYSALINEVKAWKEALELCNIKEDVVYIAWLKDIDDLGIKEPLFTTYENAYNYIKKHYDEYFSDDKDKYKEPFHAVIYCCYTDPFIGKNEGKGQFKRAYCFNKNMNLINILCYNSADSVVEDYYAYVPVPFKRGDIVAVDSLYDGEYYGVVQDTPKDERDSDICDSTSMNVIVDVLNRPPLYSLERNYFDYDTPNGLCLRFCKKGELSDENRALEVISLVHKGVFDWYHVIGCFRKVDMDSMIEMLRFTDVKYGMQEE